MSPLFTQSQGWIILVLFGAAMFITTWALLRKREQNKLEFLVAGRQVGWKRAAPAIAANWIWAPALFVAAQQGYEHGWVGVFWFTVPNVACLVLFSFFAAKARKLYPHGFTLSEAARQVYSSRVQIMYLIGLIGLAVCSFAVQLLAGALVISTLTGIDFTLISVALTLIALSYSLRMGMGAAVVTKMIDMVIIGVVGLGLSVVALIVATPAPLVAGLGGVSGEFTSLVSGPGAGVFWAFGLSTTIGLMSGPFGDQSFWQLTWATKTPRDARRSFLLGASIFAIVPLTMSILGFLAAGAQLVPADSQLTNLVALLNWLPAWVALPFIFYVLAGLVSSMDGQLCSVSSLAGNDLSRRLGFSDSVRISRVAMIAMALSALLIANIPGIAVVQLFVFYGTVRAVSMIPTMLMISWRSRAVSETGVFYGMIAAMVVGLPVSAYGNLGGVVPAIWGGSLLVLILSGGGALLGTLLSPERGRDPEKIASRTEREKLLQAA